MFYIYRYYFVIELTLLALLLMLLWVVPRDVILYKLYQTLNCWSGGKLGLISLPKLCVFREFEYLCD